MRRQVRKKWYEGLQEDPQNMGHETEFEDMFAKQVRFNHVLSQQGRNTELGKE